MTLDGIVLDLDDTLLDTTGLLLPPADERAVAAMRGNGLAMSTEDALAEIRSLRAAGVAEPFRVLADRQRAPPAAAESAEAAFFSYESAMPDLSLDPAVARALDELAALAPLALLTFGHPPTQRLKIRRLGIAERFCERVYVARDDPAGKPGALGALLQRRGWRPEHVVTAGDRPDSDVRAGNANGCRTVLVRRAGSEFAACGTDDPRDRPWREIGSVVELPRLLQSA